MRTHVLTRENNRGRHEIRVLDCMAVTPAQVGFPGVQTIAKLRRRVRRKGKKTTEIVYLITSLTLDQLRRASSSSNAATGSLRAACTMRWTSRSARIAAGCASPRPPLP